MRRGVNEIRGTLHKKKEKRLLGVEEEHLKILGIEVWREAFQNKTNSEA